jgi:hypothetical protein
MARNKISTINVVEVTADGILRLTSFKSNGEGNSLATSLFETIAKENGATQEAMHRHIANGYYSEGSYTVYLVRSQE